MDQASLHAPWRMEYIRSLHKPSDDVCFLCSAAVAKTDAQKREVLLLRKTTHSMLVINRFPYNNGHLLIAPLRHKGELDELGDDELLDLQKLTAFAVRLLKRAVSAQGFNVGINLGRAGGAGLPGHLHQHVVPRWAGDTNFISVIGQVRIVPQAIPQLYEELLVVAEKIGREEEGKK